MRLYRIAKDEGCLFTFGSDSHDDLSHKYYSNATLVANLLNLTEKDLHPLVRLKMSVALGHRDKGLTRRKKNSGPEFFFCCNKA